MACVRSAMERAELRYAGVDKISSALSRCFCFFCWESVRRCTPEELEAEEEERGGEGVRSPPTEGMNENPFVDFRLGEANYKKY